MSNQKLRNIGFSQVTHGESVAAETVEHIVRKEGPEQELLPIPTLSKEVRSLFTHIGTDERFKEPAVRKMYSGPNSVKK